jgi:hypothetical protein
MTAPWRLELTVTLVSNAVLVTVALIGVGCKHATRQSTRTT